MATGEGGFTFDEKGNDEKKSDALYTGMIPGIASTAQSYDIPQPSGAYWEPAAEIKWLKNSNNVLNQENTKLRLEIKVYKKIIENLLKKKS